LPSCGDGFTPSRCLEEPQLLMCNNNTQSNTIEVELNMKSLPHINQDRLPTPQNSTSGWQSHWSKCLCLEGVMSCFVFRWLGCGTGLYWRLIRTMDLPASLPPVLDDGSSYHLWLALALPYRQLVRFYCNHLLPNSVCPWASRLSRFIILMRDAAKLRRKYS
jgi:hypothetical protein